MLLQLYHEHVCPIHSSILEQMQQTAHYTDA